MINKIVKRVISYFLQGLLFAVPVFTTIYVIYLVFQFLDNLIPTELPGLGLLILLGCITILGFIGNTVIARPINYYFNSLLNRAPLLKTMYSAIVDLLTAFVGKKKNFNQAVMVTLDKENGIKKPGFITQEDLSMLSLKDQVAVYLPHSYNFSGNLFIVPAEQVEKMNISSSDFMKFIVSAGISSIEENKSTNEDK